jgi:DNA adenine methylase
MKSKPFIKWVGGKTRVLNHLQTFIPAYSGKYIEPMIGGGSLFFRLQPDRAVIADRNEKLARTYIGLQQQPDKVLEYLEQLSTRHEAAPSDSYYQARTDFNAGADLPWHAALFIYLNKTTYNGLWRVNKKGEYNASWGKRDHYTPDLVNLRACASVLRGVEIHTENVFSLLERTAEPGDFVYLDPPYYGTYSQFTAVPFEEADHRRMVTLVDLLIQRGCKVLLSNSDAPFVRGLYRHLPMVQLWSNRTVSTDTEKRGVAAELLIFGGFEPPTDVELVNPTQP